MFISSLKVLIVFAVNLLSHLIVSSSGKKIIFSQGNDRLHFARKGKRTKTKEINEIKTIIMKK